ncbi:MAG: hypothetical protein M1819_006950 [Sarea resinae]|nr:MAG: hypothetical protein M1819_006950 [Sarea resinae]
MALFADGVGHHRTGHVTPSRRRRAPGVHDASWGGAWCMGLPRIGSARRGRDRMLDRSSPSLRIITRGDDQHGGNLVARRAPSGKVFTEPLGELENLTTIPASLIPEPSCPPRSAQSVEMATQMPEWEVPEHPPKGRGVHLPRSLRAATLPGGKFTWSNPRVTEKFDAILPPERRYLGRSRRTVLWTAVVVLLCLIGLIVGLAVGLTRHSGSQDLPLPSKSQKFTGDLTYYAPGLGACGVTSSNNDEICAVSHLLFDAEKNGSDPNANPLCGLKIRASRFDEQVNARRSVDLKVVDRCVGCAATDLDLSPGAFDQLADPSLGRVDVTWAWLSPTPTS